MLNSSDSAKNYASTIGKSLKENSTLTEHLKTRIIEYLFDFLMNVKI